MAEGHEYQPLPDDESIRVLVLGPGKGDDPLTGDLKVVHLSSRYRDEVSSLWDKIQRKPAFKSKVRRWKTDLAYEAISYVWGTDVKDHIILLSGKPHKITANLSDALHQYRLPDQSRALWADSICIDQDNIEEKNHQVFLMGRIYASAQRTLICLGADYDNRNHARDASGVISDASQMIREVFQSPDFSWEVNCFPWPLPDDPLVNDSRWQSVDALFCHPWFSRGWVIQEAALGRETIISWAGYQFELLDLMRADLWYFRRMDHLTEKRHRQIWAPSLLMQMFNHSHNAEFKVFLQFYRWPEEQEILYVLHCARVLGLSDPRDRIFAFMALPFVGSPMPVLRPDYKQSHVELYQTFILKYLKATSDLNILSYASYDDSLDDTSGSSWVPRWDHPHMNYHGDESRNTKIKRNFGQTSAKSPNFVVCPGENGALPSLQVRAVIFDSIGMVSPQFHGYTTIEELSSVWSHWSKQAESGTYFRRNIHVSLVFLVALSGGNLPGSTPEEWADGLKSYSKFLQDSAQDSESPRSPEISPDIEICHRNLMRVAQDSNVFSLARGYHGLGSRAVKKDDVCAFVFGVRGPVILRRIPEAGDNHYKMIGTAFIVSKHLDKYGVPQGLTRSEEWTNWEELCKAEEWTDWGLKDENIILV